jgi:uncharacterized membrane protein
VLTLDLYYLGLGFFIFKFMALSFYLQENRKYLVLKEIPEGGVARLIGNKESLASCDIAVFVHDR